MGVVRFREGLLDQAEAALHHALKLSGQVCEPLVEGQARFTLAEIALATGDTAAAASHLAVATRVFDDLSSVLWQARTHILRAEIHRAQGALSAAGDAVDRAEALLSGCDSNEASRWLSRVADMRADLADT
jgi:ATP/maltotriose-dependent transcriptional regulator MalT